MICPFCKAPQDPATGHCTTPGCGNRATPAHDGDPLDDPGYQQFLVDAAKTCCARHAPCPGCVSGGMCDGHLGGVFSRRDEDSDNGEAERDYNEDSR